MFQGGGFVVSPVACDAAGLQRRWGYHNSPYLGRLVAKAGLEPATSWLWAKRATGLLYPALKIKDSGNLMV